MLVLLAAAPASGVRLKDLASIEGVRENMLLGYGLVVGLAGTGDRQQTVFSTQSLSNLLQKMGVNVSPTALRVNNVAAVMATSSLPAFARPGARIDVTVSSIGDAKNLQGGTLLLTSLKAANGEVYAVAQGPLSIGGFSAGRGGSGVQVNHPTVGRIPEGAVVERSAPSVPPSPEGFRPGFPFWPSWSVYDSRLPAAMQRFSHCCQVRYSFRCRSGLRMLADHGVPAKPEGPLATPLPRRPSAIRVRWLFRAVDVTLRAQVAPKSAAACRRTTSGSDAPPQAATNNIARASRAARPSSSADAASSSATSF